MHYSTSRQIMRSRQRRGTECVCCVQVAHLNEHECIFVDARNEREDNYFYVVKIPEVHVLKSHVRYSRPRGLPFTVINMFGSHWLKHILAGTAVETTMVSICCW